MQQGDMQRDEAIEALEGGPVLAFAVRLSITPLLDHIPLYSPLYGGKGS